jgi:hypothetical protein
VVRRPRRLAIWIVATHDGGRGSPIGGDAPGQARRCSADISIEGSSREFRSRRGQDNQDYELEVIAVKIAAGQDGFLLVMHVRPTDLPEEG